MLKTSPTVHWAGVMMCGLAAGGMHGAALGQCEAEESSKSMAVPQSAVGDLFGNADPISYGNWKTGCLGGENGGPMSLPDLPGLSRHSVIPARSVPCPTQSESFHRG